MSTRLPSILNRPVAFGTAGHTLTATDKTQVAPTTPGSGVVGTVWLTSDGVAVVSPHNRIGGRLRGKLLSSIEASQLPPSALTVTELCHRLQPDWQLSLDLSKCDAIDAVLRDTASLEAERRLWIRHHDQTMLAQWRSRTTAKLIKVAPRAGSGGGLERQAADLESRGLDGLMLPHQEWSGGRAALLHRFHLLAIASGATYERELAAVVDAGIDGIHSNYPEQTTAVISEYYGDL